MTIFQQKAFNVAKHNRDITALKALYPLVSSGKKDIARAIANIYRNDLDSKMGYRHWTILAGRKSSLKRGSYGFCQMTKGDPRY